MPAGLSIGGTNIAGQRNILRQAEVCEAKPHIIKILPTEPLFCTLVPKWFH